MAEMDPQTQRRITFLSVFAALTPVDTKVDPSGALDVDYAYDNAMRVVRRLEEDDLFAEPLASQFQPPQAPQQPRQQPQQRPQKGNFGPLDASPGSITEAQARKIIRDSNGQYSHADLASYSKQQASDLINQLVG